MPLGNPVYIEAPSVVPARGGLYAVANVIDGDSHIGASGAQYLSENCGIASGLDDPACLTAEDRAEKTFGEIDVVSGDPFAVYKGTVCVDIHGDDSEWARRGLELSETVAVEQGTMSGLLQGATDLTPVGGPVSLINGIAALEGYAASNYGGLATLHMPRSVATRALAFEVLENSMDWTITTRQGSLVANGGGYELNLGPDGTPAEPGTAWIYVTGMVTVVRAPLVVNRVLGVGEGLNVQRALAERMVAVTAECIKAAILVALDPSDV